MDIAAFTAPTVTSDKAVVPAWPAKGWSAGTSWEIDLMLGKIWGAVHDNVQYQRRFSSIAPTEEYELQEQPARIDPSTGHETPKRKRSFFEIETDSPVYQRRRHSESDLRGASKTAASLRRRISEADIQYEINFDSTEFPSPAPIYTKHTVLPSPSSTSSFPSPLGGQEAINAVVERDYNIADDGDDDDTDVELEYVEFADAGCGRDDEDYEENMDMNSHPIPWDNIIETREVRRKSCYSGYESLLETIGETPEPEEEYKPRCVQKHNAISRPCAKHTFQNILAHRNIAIDRDP